MSSIDTASLLSQPFDCLLLVHPHIQTLEAMANEILGLGVPDFNLGKALSETLMSVSVNERPGYTQKWLVDTLAGFQQTPVLCTRPDLLFEPSLLLDPLALFRQVARIKQIIVLWPGEYTANTLTYAVPEHHHYRTWKVSDSLLRQPRVLIHPISLT